MYLAYLVWIVLSGVGGGGIKEASLNAIERSLENPCSLIDGKLRSRLRTDFFCVQHERIMDLAFEARCKGRLFVKTLNSSILQSEFIFEKAIMPSCHASTLVEVSDGSLIAAWFAGTKEMHPDVGIWASRWKDGTWSTPVEVANGIEHLNPNAKRDRYPTWNPVLYQVNNDGSSSPLMLYYKVGPSPQSWWGMVITSNDNGATWSEPQRLPLDILGPIKNKPVRLSNGDLLSPSSTESTGSVSKWQVHFEVSSDVGRTWRKIGPVNDGISIQAIQPTLLKLGGDKLLAVGRSQQNKIFEIESDDNGTTWGAMRLGTLPNNNSGIDAVTLRDGRHLLIYNHVAGTPGQWGGKRTPLNIAISDDGFHWRAAAQLESGEGEYSYPAIIQTDDGLVHATYTWNRKRIKHVVIDPLTLIGQEMIDGKWPAELE